MAETHEHDYTELKLFRITKIDNPNYNGTAGDKAFITYVCKCGKATPISYGSYEAMKEKLEQLKEKV